MTHHPPDGPSLQQQRPKLFLPFFPLHCSSILVLSICTAEPKLIFLTFPFSGGGGQGGGQGGDGGYGEAQPILLLLQPLCIASFAIFFSLKP